MACGMIRWRGWDPWSQSLGSREQGKDRIWLGPEGAGREGRRPAQQRLSLVRVGGQGLPLCAALGTKGQSPAGQQRQGLDQLLQTRKGGGHPGAGLGLC